MDGQEIREILATCSYNPVQDAVILDLAMALKACPHTDGKRALPVLMDTVESGWLHRSGGMVLAENAPQIIIALREMTGWSAARVMRAIDQAEVDLWMLTVAIARTVWKTR